MDPMKLPGLDVKALLADIDPGQFNPVRCCVCTGLGLRETKGRDLTIVRGYAVCLDHLGVDEHPSLREYVEAIRAAFSIAACSGGCGTPVAGRGDRCGRPGCR
ncbi:hypothetical protein [Mycobacterium phage Weirdo19]|uniref:Uncharacterized protein n=1 Tax=Mycobacterium phage Weirdo19 TaxID=2601610 RepID=A0A6M2YSU6_9CAUD|nr:hypothetical protein KDJ11_gp75 [Mycobacterium phage Weirdo19]QEA10843.1 hypothetical protein [Mycobacterium phage Weirdo19]